MAAASSDYTLSLTPFPAATHTATASVASTPTTCTRISFADRIMVTLSQEGRLAYWLQTPLTSPIPTSLDPYITQQSSSETSTVNLPPSHLTPAPLLGTPPSSVATFTQLLATQTGGLILEKTQQAETRPLVLGVGFGKDLLRVIETQGGDTERRTRAFEELLGLVLEVI